jgi:hypothetical protein
MSCLLKRVSFVLLEKEYTIMEDFLQQGGGNKK